jgi:menaquinone-dependent protoporphyrinogen oxidase
MASVLVVYATKYGSTQEVAEAVADSLREQGLDVDVRPAADPGGVDRYSAVVVGGALYYFRWMRDARKFLSRHRKTLEHMPVAAFGMGPWNEDPEKLAEELADALRQLEKALAKFEWLKPAAVASFGGVFDPAKLRFPDNNPAMKSMPAADARDWDAIRAWSETLPTAFRLVPPEPGADPTAGARTA